MEYYIPISISIQSSGGSFRVQQFLWCRSMVDNILPSMSDIYELTLEAILRQIREKVVKILLGNSDLQTTLRYIAVSCAIFGGNLLLKAS